MFRQKDMKKDVIEKWLEYQKTMRRHGEKAREKAQKSDDSEGKESTVRKGKSTREKKGK